MAGPDARPEPKPDPGAGPTVSDHSAYAEIAHSEEFRRLRGRHRGFAFPWTVAFLAWYLLYVACANWAPGLMSTKVAGNVNVALVWGLLQFLSTFVIAFLYSRHARRHLDPVAGELNDRFESTRSQTGAAS
ncbi:DUF485 domain-containing protein [Actinopolymorpha singaporensis]|uniref:Uncharacterized membrane protein, DUF485 family n=1 Tax=Actinopolymorpha singaporensis TaxID=117157 RepID=A0A1H1Q190_9ACTN|nr:DUF485 domain-containing protein [Actinopolymorpha singaporensis]SDS17195.1 Uncharacterized membrane protein, DUF485 family [Actinopolymorpha singaporensis]